MSKEVLIQKLTKVVSESVITIEGEKKFKRMGDAFCVSVSAETADQMCDGVNWKMFDSGVDEEKEVNKSTSKENESDVDDNNDDDNSDDNLDDDDLDNANSDDDENLTNEEIQELKKTVTKMGQDELKEWASNLNINIDDKSDAQIKKELLKTLNKMSK